MSQPHPPRDQSSAAATNGSTMPDDAKIPSQPDPSPPEHTFPVIIKLPHPPYSTQTIVSTQDQIQDIRQSIIDLPYTFQYSCFHLEREGQRVPDFVDIGEIPGIVADVELSLVEDPYTEKDARIHVLRVRELIGAAGDRSDLVQGIQAGLSFHDRVARSLPDTQNDDGQQNGTKATHAMSAYNHDDTPSLSTYLVPSNESAPKTIKAISLSPWNPPPPALRMKGHLLYLLLTTNEGEQHQITAHVSGFYVNKCSNTKFDPFPRQTPKATRAHSLLTLISRLSPSFEAAFKSLQDFNGRKDLLAAFQLSNAIPASPWIVHNSSSSIEHMPDICRTQETFLVAGVDNAETLRDWNEEFQTTRELPRETVQDRVFRERVTSKLFADYTEAAVLGAVLIARGEVASLNPTEPRDAQIFVYNNVFYSFGADGVGTFAHEGGDEAARAATGKDVMGVKMVNQVDIPGLATPGTVIVDYLGKRIVCQSIVPGIFKQREPGEHQIDYGGVEGKDVVADNSVFAPLFKKLSDVLRVKGHPVWDKDGKRHDLEASIETKGLLGTDGRKYILDVYRITPIDINWVEANWQTPSDDTNIKDPYPHRMTVLRPELVESFWRSRLRAYVRTQLAESAAKKKEVGDSKDLDNHEDLSNGNETLLKTSEKAEGGESSSSATASRQDDQERVDLSAFQFALNPDVFCGQKPQSSEEQEVWAGDEADVRAAADYLHAEVMPRLASDLLDGEVGFPMDGVSLAALMHKRGINIRYLGKLAGLAAGDSPRAQALRRLTEQEMISRAVKHVINAHLKNLPFVFSNACIAHILNCFLGVGLNAHPQPSCDEELRPLYQTAPFEFESLNLMKFRQLVADQVFLRYRYKVDTDWSKSINTVAMLREVCLKAGLQIRAKDYVFEPLNDRANGHAVSANGSLAPITNGAAAGGKKGRKKAIDNSPNRADSHAPTTPTNLTFQPEDILNIVPIIKDAAPRSTLADEALEAGRISVAQNQKELGQELLLESLSLHEQIYGIIHTEVARVYYNLSTLFYSLDDKAVASELARKAVIVSERTLGVDHNETVLAYLNLGLFEHANGNTKLALQYIRHALDLWRVVYGQDHPDTTTTLNNIAVMLQNLKLYHDSRVWFERSLTMAKMMSGTNSSNTATLLFQLAQALALDQDSKAAVNCMREAYNIFNSTLGPEDRNTKEAETWLEQLTQNAVSIAKHAKDVQARRLRRLNVAPGMTMGTRPQTQAGQTEQDAASGRSLAGATSKGTQIDERSVEELMRYIEGGDRKKTRSKKAATHPKQRQQKA